MGKFHPLFWLSLIPVVTEWVGSFYKDHWPAATYGIVALGAAISFPILVFAIIRANGRDLVGCAIGSDLKGNVSMALYACGIGLASLSPYWRMSCTPLSLSSGSSQIDASSGPDSHPPKTDLFAIGFDQK